MVEDWQNGGFGLYVHWPFCAAKCPYCDFNSHVAGEVDHDRWKEAYLREIDRVSENLGGRVLRTVFFGGGTPSLMAPDTVAAIIGKIRQVWPVANDLEVTLEANPGSVEAGRFAAYADAGVSRLSMGLQALNDEDLRRLGRLHTVAESRQAFDIAKEYFSRVSFDLIYARQHQTVAEWRAELREALSMAVDHLSLYHLTIEPGTAFGERYATGRLSGLPDEETGAAMYEATQDICEGAGMPAYEISNHAGPGAESRQNLIYWRYGDYAGIGPGAHGRLTIGGQRYATEAWAQPDRWLAAAAAGSGDKSATALSPQEQAEEYLMMGLRIAEGLDLDRYRRLAGRDLPPDTLDHLAEIGTISRDGARIHATSRGRMVLNAVIETLLQG